MVLEIGPKILAYLINEYSPTSKYIRIAPLRCESIEATITSVELVSGGSDRCGYFLNKSTQQLIIRNLKGEAINTSHLDQRDFGYLLNSINNAIL